MKSAPVGRYADGEGLWLIKTERARGKWVLRIFVGGRRREMGLGRWPDVSIGEAREKASDARKQTRSNLDPIEERRRAKRAVRLTLKEAIDGCFEARKAQLKEDGEAGRWMSPLRVHVIPKLGNMSVEAVDQHILRDILAPIWHTKPEASAKALNRINLALQHAAALGLPVDMQACMRARALLGKQRHTTAHIPALPYDDAPAFYRSLRSMEGVSALALRFLILTCARTTEVRHATFDEIRDDVWTLPAERTKTGVARRIPLCREALKVLAQCRTRSERLLFVAYKEKPISDAAMATLMKRQGHDARPHGFRATFRTWCEECTDADYETKETCLGHVVDTGAQAAYQRSDRLGKRGKLLTRWEHFLLG